MAYSLISSLYSKSSSVTDCC